MRFEYDKPNFWNQLATFTANVRDQESGPLSKHLEDDAKAFAVWKAFFSSTSAGDVELFTWLFSLRPDLVFKNCPFAFEHDGRSFKGCTLLQMMLLLKPCHEYLTLLKDSLTVLDSDGNSTLCYAALCDKFSIYERVWKVCGPDGERSRRPGPETAALLVKFGSDQVIKELSLPHLIETLGGLEAALSLAIKEKSKYLANELLKLIKDKDLKEFIRMAMSEPFVDFETFLLVTEVEDHGLPIVDVLKRAYSLCQKTAHYKRFFKLVVRCKESQKLTESLDELVAFTGLSYDLLYAIRKHPTTMGTLSSAWPPGIFDLKYEEHGSYLHFVCQRIGEYQPFIDGPEMQPWHCTSLNVCYMPRLLKYTKEEHWTVKDAQGNKPMKYLGEVIKNINADLLTEIKRRNDSDRIAFEPTNDPYTQKNDSCCMF